MKRMANRFVLGALTSVAASAMHAQQPSSPVGAGDVVHVSKELDTTGVTTPSHAPGNTHSAEESLAPWDRPYGNYLGIGGDAKEIPYAPSRRAHGQPNYGFRLLKGQPDDVPFIPEAHIDPALGALLRAANDSSTAIFTVGCSSVSIGAGEHNLRRGYVEFALNDSMAAQSLMDYFGVFLEFDQTWRAARGEYRVGFVWQLGQVLFKVRDVEGFTFTVWIMTGDYPTPEEADACWRHALGSLQALLVKIPPPGVGNRLC